MSLRRSCTTLASCLGLIFPFAVEAQRESTGVDATAFVALDSLRAVPTLLTRAIAIDIRVASLERALRTIADSGNIRIVYSDPVLRADRRVTLRSSRLTVAQALWQSIQGTGLVLATTPNGSIVLVEEEATVRGRITDAATGAPVVGARISVEGARAPITSDDSGHYRISGLSAGSLRIRFARLGYLEAVRTVEVAPMGETVLDVTLSPAPTLIAGVNVLTTSGYAVSTTSGATKTDTPLLDVPQSVQVVSSTLLEEQRTLRVADALRNVSGVVPEAGNAGTMDGFFIRGFTQYGVMVNGFGHQRVGPQAEIANLERIEVLKGPSSVLYGAASAGGVVNLVTKRPQRIGRRSIDLSAGSFGGGRGVIDATGPIGGNERILYRMVGSLDRSGSYRDRVETDRRFVAPSIAIDVGPQTSLLVTGQYTYQDRPALTSGGVVIGDEIIRFPHERNFAPGYQFFTFQERMYDAVLSQQLGSRWSLRLALQGMSNTNDQVATYFTGVEADAVTAGRAMYGGPDGARQAFFQGDLVGEFSTGPTSHRVLVGSEIGKDSYRMHSFFTDFPSVNLNSPGADPPRPTLSPDNWFYYGMTNRHRSVYVQDQVELTRMLKVLIGARRSSVRLRERYAFGDTLTDGENVTAVTPRYGLVVQPTRAVSLYAGYHQSFEPVFGTDLLGNRFDPERGRQTEVGAKVEWFAGRLISSAAWFDLRRQNVKTRDPDNPARDVQIGEQQSRGFEIDVSGSPTDRWNIIASYSNASPKVTREKRYPVGARLANIPTVTASLWSTYERPLSGRTTLGIGAGANHVGDREGELSAESAFQLPSYTVVNALAFVRQSRWRISLNVQNVADAKYFETGQGRLNLIYGQPRAVLLSLLAEF